MTEISLGHARFLGLVVFAIVVGSLSFLVLAIPVKRRRFPLDFVVEPSTAKRAVPFVAMALLLLAAGCAADKPALLLTGGPPRIPHSLEGREGQCLLCHEQGVAGAPKVSANHVGRTADICPLCHIPAAASAHSPLVSATIPPAETAAPLPVVGATPSQAGGPPRIPHSLQGREGQCLMCHEAGVAGAPRVPTNHIGRTSDMCSMCHLPAAAPAHSAAVGATPSPGAMATTSPASGPPRIPHSLEGRVGQCLMCHESGVAGAPKVPANHAGRTSDICTGCHQPSATGS